MTQIELTSHAAARRDGFTAALKVPILAMLGATAFAASFVLLDTMAVLGAQVAGATLLALAALSAVMNTRKKSHHDVMVRTVSGFVENDTTPSFMTDPDGEITYKNPAACERFHEHAVDTLGQAFMDLFANPAAVLFRLQSKAHALGSAREDIVTRRGHVRLTVNQIDASAYLWRLEDLGDKASGGRAADALSLPMLTAGPSGTVLFMNEAFRRLLGGRAKSLDKIFPQLPLVSGKLHRVEAANGPIQSLVALVSGTGGRSEVYLLPSEGIESVSLVSQVVATDWDAIEELPVPLLKVAATGEIIASNREARVLLQKPITDHSRLSDLLEGLGRPIIDWLQEVAEGRGSLAPQFLRGTGAQKDTFVQVTLNPAGDRESAHLIAVLNDVTELKSLEAQFVQSQKMQAIGQLAGGVAHDFNNLLTAISGHCDLLLLRHDQGDQDYSDLVQIHQNSNRAASLVAQLLAFSRKQNLRPEVFDLRDTFSEMAHLLNRLVGEKVRLTLDHDPGLLPIRADKRQLEQVLMNLVVNARDALPQGGDIRVETENATLSVPLKRDRATVPTGSYVVVRVIDAGTGISPESMPKIFEPFYSTKRPGEGTGLGLSTAYGIVKQTGGFIFADSKEGAGTTFSLYFPSHEKPLEAPVQTPVVETPVPQARAEGVVLLVEDEAPVRAFASRALRLRGYTVLEADCAESALHMLADPDLRVDIFVTDVIMPGKDGPTWVREALTARPDTKVVFVSGYAEDAFGENQAQIPNSVFLPKPFSLNDLTSTVSQQLQ
ncbi:MAG: two-component system cell cycle sensor histidine kinase/response regulator CckA [Paracoccaceae bacterium]